MDPIKRFKAKATYDKFFVLKTGGREGVARGEVLENAYKNSMLVNYGKSNSLDFRSVSWHYQEPNQCWSSKEESPEYFGMYVGRIIPFLQYNERTLRTTIPEDEFMIKWRECNSRACSEIHTFFEPGLQIWYEFLLSKTHKFYDKSIMPNKSVWVSFASPRHYSFFNSRFEKVETEYKNRGLVFGESFESLIVY